MVFDNSGTPSASGHRPDEGVAEEPASREATLGALSPDEPRAHEDSEEGRRSAFAEHERFEAIVSNIRDVVFATDLEGTIIYVSAGITRMSGYWPHEVMGRRFTDLVFAEDVARVRASFRDSLSGGTAAVEFRAVDANRDPLSLRAVSRARYRENRVVGLEGILTDMTALTQVREELESSEARFRALLDSISDVVWAAPADRSGYFYLSTSVHNVFGRAPEEFEADPGLWLDVVHPDDRARVAEHDERLDREGRVEDRYRIVRPDGSIRWLDDRKRTFYDAGGQPVQIGGIATDVTERVEAERALVEFSDRLERLVAVTRDMARAQTVAQAVAVVRDAVRSLLECDGVAIAMREDDETCHYIEEDAIGPLWKGRRVPMAECMSGWAMRADRAAIVSDVARDERARPAFYAGTFVRGMVAVPIGRGRPVGALGAYWSRPYEASPREIQLQQSVADSLWVAIDRIGYVGKLEARRAQMRAIYDHLPNPTLVWRRAGDEFVLTDFNVAARELLGGTLLERVGQAAGLWSDGVPYIVEDLERCFGGRAPIRRETLWTLPNAGAPRRMSATFSFIPSDMVLIHAEDVTAQRRTEEHLQRAQRLEAIGRLAGGVAHDFNNLLTVMLTHAGFVADELEDGSQARADIETIREAGARAAGLTKQLLLFGRKETREPIPLQLNEVVEGVGRMLSRVLGADIEIGLRLSHELGNVFADRVHVEQVIMNLAVNARDAMPDGGRLALETGNLEIGPAGSDAHPNVPPGRYVELSVADTGVGMSREVMDHIFDPFFTTKELGKGTGLGLSTVYAIVEQSCGHVAVASVPGQGTTFRILLPRVDGTAESLPAESTRVSPSRHETVLVAEDEPAVRALAVRVLTRAGYRVLAAQDGREAAELAERYDGPIDLVLTDVVMPTMNGRQLAERIAATRPDIRVVFMSGYTDDILGGESLRQLGSRFMTKPFAEAQLTRTVREALDSPPIPITLRTRRTEL